MNRHGPELYEEFKAAFSSNIATLFNQIMAEEQFQEENQGSM